MTMHYKIVFATLAVLIGNEFVFAQQIPSTTTAAEMWNPWTWFWPYAIASAEGYRDYYDKAQKATNELYQQIYKTNAFPWVTGNWGSPQVNPSGGSGGSGQNNPTGGSGSSGQNNPTGGSGGQSNPTGGSGGSGSSSQNNPTDSSGGSSQSNPSGGSSGSAQSNTTGGSGDSGQKDSTATNGGSADAKVEGSA